MKFTMDQKYRINDVLESLASEMGVEIDDDTLNQLTHHVANILEGNPEVAYVSTTDGTPGYWVIDGQGVYATQAEAEAEVERRQTPDPSTLCPYCPSMSSHRSDDQTVYASNIVEMVCDGCGQEFPVSLDDINEKKG